MALQKISEIYTRGNITIVCGGTGLYIDHLLYEINLPECPKNQKLREELKNKNCDELFEILKEIAEPKIASQFSAPEYKNNKHRIIRTIELVKHFGYYPEVKKKLRFKNAEIIVTNLNKDTFKEKILKRTLDRLKAGMLEEIISVKEKYKLTDEYLKNLGFEYSLCLEYISKKISYESFLKNFVTKEYQYAKRQITWFKKYIKKQ
jgi:tRNA dimethylallyltransferase